MANVKISSFPNASTNMASVDRVTGLQGGVNVNFSKSQILTGTNGTSGGSISVYGGSGTSGNGGNLYLYGGASSGGSHGGNVYIRPGVNSGSNPNGSVYIGSVGPGGNSSVYIHGRGTGGQVYMGVPSGPSLFAYGTGQIHLFNTGGKTIYVNIPSSSAGIASGGLYTSAGVVMVKP